MTKKHTVNRLVNAIAPALPIRNTTQTRTGAQANATRDNTRLVTNNITEQVTRDHNTVQAARVLDQDHSRAVDKLVLELELRELVLHGLSNDLTPQPTTREHIRLIQTPHRSRRVARKRSMRRHPCDPDDLLPRVQLRVPRHVPLPSLLPLPEVYASGQLADDGEVGAAHDLRFEGREVDEGVGGEEARAQVAVGLHLLAQLQDALLRTHVARAPFGPADGAEEHRVRGLGGREGRVCERYAVGVDGALFTCSR